MVSFTTTNLLGGENFVTQKLFAVQQQFLKPKRNYLELGNIEIERDWGYAPDYVLGMWLMLQQKKPADSMFWRQGQPISCGILEIAFPIF